MRRLDHSGLLRLGEQLPRGERTLIEVVSRLHLMSGAQLATIIGLGTLQRSASEASAARQARRVLSQLTDLGLLARLTRHIGGIRAGSSGYVYYLGPAGQRLIAYWQGQGLVRGRYRPEPGGRYVHHRLAVSQLYVDLRVAEAAGALDLLRFDAEPDCWRTHDQGFGQSIVIKADAYVRLGVGAYEERAFLEVDLGTESRPVIARKLRTYAAYYKSGQEQAEHGVFPRVVLLTNSEARKAALVYVAARLPAEDWHLFSIGLLDQAVPHLRGDADDRDQQEEEVLA